MKLKCLLLGLFVLTASGCVTIQDKIVCSPAGTVLAGAVCSHTNSPSTFDMDFGEYIDFLEARPERPDPKDPTRTLPAKGASITLSAEDYGRWKVETETMCRMLGKKCSFEIELK